MRTSLAAIQRSFLAPWAAAEASSPYLCYGLFACAVLLYYGLSFNYGIDLDDEGLLIGGAAAINAGKFPIADFYSYQPWMYFSLAGFFRLFGTTLITERVFLIVLLLASSLCVLWLARQVLPAGPSLIPAVFYAAAPGAWYKVFFIFHLLLVLATLFLFNARPRPARAFLAGLAAGFALVSRAEAATIAVALFAGALGLVMISDVRVAGRKWGALVGRHLANIVSYAAGCLLPVAIFAEVYWAAGKLDALLTHLKYTATPIPYEQVITLSGRADVFSPSSLLSNPQLTQWFYGASLIACLAFFLVNLIAFFRGAGARADVRRKLILAAAALGSMSYTFFFVWNSRMLSSFAIVYLAEIALLYQVGTLLAQRSKGLPVAVGSVLLALVVHAFCATNFYSGSITMRVLTPGHSTHPFLKGMTVDAGQVRSIDMLKKIADADPGAYLVPMSEATTMGFLSGLTNPTYYTIFTIGLFGKERQEKAIDTFERLKIKYFVGRSGEFFAHGAPASDLSAYAPLVRAYLVSHYDIRRLGDSYVLLTRRGSAPPSGGAKANAS
ncbi:MAG TPA: hypothetical protein VFT69_12950 [Pseudolabrys sp.]|nr:hypothetical protein [Pseudolabrys sp.]